MTPNFLITLVPKNNQFKTQTIFKIHCVNYSKQQVERETIVKKMCAFIQNAKTHSNTPA